MSTFAAADIEGEKRRDEASAIGQRRVGLKMRDSLR
jgi:hypothetical protein